MARKQAGQSSRLELCSLLEELSREVGDELAGPVSRVLSSVRKDDFPPSREDLAVIVHHLLSRERARRTQAAVQGGPKAASPPARPPRRPPGPPRPAERVSSDESGKRSIGPQLPAEAVGSVFHDRIRESETEEDRTLRRRLGLPKRK